MEQLLDVLARVWRRYNNWLCDDIQFACLLACGIGVAQCMLCKIKTFFFLVCLQEYVKSYWRIMVEIYGRDAMASGSDG